MVGGTIHHKRLLELDAMRGIAAMLVLLYHFNFKYEPRDPTLGQLPLLFGWGHHGVSLFFAISGFVNSMTLGRMDSVSGFAWSRFSRLFPVYWAAMAITMIVVLIGNDQKLMVSPQVALANATMMHYWFDIQSVDGSYWGLSIELSFYLVMALVLHLRLLKRLELVLAGWLRFMKYPLLLWLGAISYPLYLIHQYVGYVLIDHLAAMGLSLLTATGMALVAVVALAHILHICVENPSQLYLRDLRRTRLTPAE